MTVSTRLPDDRDQTPEAVRRLCELINSVYDVAEAGMWKPHVKRTTTTEVARLVADQALILAEADGAVVGSVHVQLLPENIGEFGMLVAAPAQRGKGIGSALVEAAESWARAQGCRKMQLELLTPKYWKHPNKVFLAGWYTRIGYAPLRQEAFGNADALSTPCDFTVWWKGL